MNWITNVVRPKIRTLLGRREMPENLWIKCPETGQMVFHKDLEANQFVIPGSGYHMRMSATARLKVASSTARLVRRSTFPRSPVDPLKFRDERRYTDRLKDARAKTGLEDAVQARLRQARRAAGRRRRCRISTSWAARSAWRPARR